MENKSFKLLVLIAVIIYTLAPDLMPGPVDDIIVMILGYMISSKKEKNMIVDTEDIK